MGVGTMTADVATFFKSDLGVLVGKVILVAVMAVVARCVERVLTRMTREGLEKADVPNASIFVNVVRGTVWIIALLMILQPVFGVAPNALITSLGAASIAVSLGLQTTISNLVGGLTLMVTKTIKPGDYITVNGITGQVTDVSWRDTTVRDRLGNAVVVPNSQLNSSAITKIAVRQANMTSLDVTLKAGCDVADACAKIREAADKALGRTADPASATRVVCTATGSDGTKVSAYFDVDPSVTFQAATDAVVRALEGASYLA